MKTANELKQERFELLEKLDALNTKVGERAFEEKEQSEYDDIKSRVTSLESQITRAEDREHLAALRAGRKADKSRKGGEGNEKANIAKRFRFQDSIRSLMPNKKLEGLSLEMHQEAIKEARGTGNEVNGVGVPSWLVKLHGGQRDLTVGGSGGNTVATDLEGFIPPLTPKLKVLELGATLIPGLTSNLDIPRQTAYTAMTWEGETDGNAESDVTFDKVQLRPKRGGLLTEVSKQSIVQSNLGLENLLRRDLERAIEIGLDRAAINGSGSDPIPEGILNVTGIGNVALGSNGAAPTRDSLVKLWKEIAIDNADEGELAFLTDPATKAKLMVTKVDVGSGKFIWEEGAQTLLGYRAETSTQVPNNLTKGSGSDLSSIIFGYWPDLIIGQWAGLDFVIDPYTKADQTLVRLVINSWYDIKVRHAESFAAIKDVVTTIS